MKSFNFKYIHNIAAENITAFKDIFKNPRLRKSLWFEFIINPEIIKKSKKYLGEPSVNAQLKKALS